MRLRAWLAAGLCLTEPAAAATVSAASVVAENKRVAEVTQAYAACIVRHNRDQATRAVLTAANNDRIAEDYPRLIDDDCVKIRPHGGSLSITFGGASLLYAIAEVLVKEELANRALNDLADVGPLKHVLSMDKSELEPPPGKSFSKKKLAELQGDYDRSQAAYYLSQFGECVVRRSPTEAKTLIFAAAQSPEEKAALQSLMPALSECTPAGSKLTYNRLALRGAVAINYYRLAKAPLKVAAGAEGAR